MSTSFSSDTMACIALHRRQEQVVSECRATEVKGTTVIHRAGFEWQRLADRPPRHAFAAQATAGRERRSPAGTGLTRESLLTRPTDEQR